MNKRKIIPIGIEDFKTLIDRNCYYVDKTLMIRDILDSGAMVNLFTRPRRFGKSLNMSMLRYFFEAGEDHSQLFQGLAIFQCDKSYLSHMGKYPVISITLKSVEGQDFDTAYDTFKTVIGNEFERHYDIIKSDALKPRQIRRYEAIYNGEASEVEYRNSLLLLSECLYTVCRQKPIILIDEYDVPLQNAYFHGYYDRMVDFIRALFSSALKTNDNLAFAVLTGCLRVSKESIFTGLNNLNVNNIRSGLFSESFGFSESEVQTLSEYYGLSDRFQTIKEWYDGYRFGNTEIYNPWSVLKYLDDSISIPDKEPEAYWSNTSSNSIIHEIISKGNRSIREDIEKLINGLQIEKQLHEDITYADINIKEDSIWSFLLYTGYLKPLSFTNKNDLPFFRAVIPNKEVRTIYENTFRKWFEREVDSTKSKFLQAVLSKDVKTLEYELNTLLMRSISYYDDLEAFYHGLLTGLLTADDRYEVISNQENGNGRTDIIITDQLGKELAVVIEVKSVKDELKLQAACDEAIKQIHELKYPATLAAKGYPVILKYGIAFCKKQCLVKLDEAE